MQLDKIYLQIRQTRSGPAFTVNLLTPKETKIDVDLVPCFEFDHQLKDGYKPIENNRVRFIYYITFQIIIKIKGGSAFGGFFQSFFHEFFLM